jgi:predicted Zn finger-like uncharacterized protein
MIVTCKACSTKYQLAQKDLASKTLRCGQCGYSWLSKAKSMHQRVRHEILYLKASKQRQPAKNSHWIKSATSVLFFAALLLGLLLFQNFWIKNIPITAEMYNFIGLPSTQGCVVRNVYVLKTGGQIELNGIIKNNATTSRQVPALKISIFYQDTKVPETFLISAPARHVSPHEQYFFHQKIPETDRRLKSVVVEIVSRSEDLLRSLIAH